VVGALTTVNTGEVKITVVEACHRAGVRYIHTCVLALACFSRDVLSAKGAVSETARKTMHARNSFHIKTVSHIV